MNKNRLIMNAFLNRKNCKNAAYGYCRCANNCNDLFFVNFWFFLDFLFSVLQYLYYSTVTSKRRVSCLLGHRGVWFTYKWRLEVFILNLLIQKLLNFITVLLWVKLLIFNILIKQLQKLPNFGLRNILLVNQHSNYQII